MAVTSYRGVVKGQTVILDGDVELPDGTGVVVTLLEGADGSPQAILAALEASPSVSHEDVAELLRLIEEGKRPVRYDDPLARGSTKAKR